MIGIYSSKEFAYVFNLISLSQFPRVVKVYHKYQIENYRTVVLMLLICSLKRFHHKQRHSQDPQKYLRWSAQEQLLWKKKPLTIFAKLSNLDACGGVNYASGKLANIVMKLIVFFQTIFSNKKIYSSMNNQQWTSIFSRCVWRNKMLKEGLLECVCAF